MAEADYPVVIASLPAEDGGGHLGTVPDLPGCMSDGATREEAAHNVADAIAAWIEEATATGRPVPSPSRRLAAAGWPRRQRRHVSGSPSAPSNAASVLRSPGNSASMTRQTVA